MKTRWVVVIVVVALAFTAAAGWVWAGTMNGSSDEETVITGPPESGMLMQVIYSDAKRKKGTIKNSSQKHWVVKTSSRTRSTGTTGPCYTVYKKKYGDSGTFAHIVSGTGIFHYCVGRLHPERIAKYWTNITLDDNFWLGWAVDWSRIEKQSPIVWTSTWCTNDGSGPCYPVQRKTLEWRWQFVRSVYFPILDKVLVQHGTFYATCTVRGNAPNRAPNEECYGGWVH